MGWCSTHSIPLRVPPELTSHLEEEEAKEEAIKAVEEAQGTGESVTEEALDVDGYTAVDRIKCGMKVEVSGTMLLFFYYIFLFIYSTALMFPFVKGIVWHESGGKWHGAPIYHMFSCSCILRFYSYISHTSKAFIGPL